jgi:hypothetical protein
MREYEFELVFRLPHGEEPDQYFQTLEEVCDDAIVGTGQQGFIALDFCREADSAQEAVYSAIKDIRRVINGAILVEASPDLVGITDVANILEVSRQYIRKLMSDVRFLAPEPVHQGTTVIYHFSEILRFLNESNKKKIEASILEIAETNKKLNMYNEIMKSLEKNEKETNECLGKIIPDDIRSILEDTPQNSQVVILKG